jgi:hypothetical protein
MEDIFDPRLGLRWTASSDSGYSITRISTKDTSWGEGTSNIIPLRLHEARAALLGTLPTPENMARQTMRTSTVTFNGDQLSCILLSKPGSAVPASGRSWDETEECVDPQSGLLRLSSQVPGRYFAYDYTNGPRLGTRMLPRRITVSEGGKTVSTISVESLTDLPSAEPGLFVPTARMGAPGEIVTMGAAQKMSRIATPGPATSDTAVRPVCVFGLVTPSGQLVEAHSLQPSDPNSAAAVEDAKKINFAPQPPAAGKLQQHFVFVIERFY